MVGPFVSVEFFFKGQVAAPNYLTVPTDLGIDYVAASSCDY
jgi:hypothetical protein